MIIVNYKDNKNAIALFLCHGKYACSVVRVLLNRKQQNDEGNLHKNGLGFFEKKKYKLCYIFLDLQLLITSSAGDFVIVVLKVIIYPL